MGRLQGKVAIITGAASGMGASHTKAFLREGAHVVFTDVNKEAGEKFSTELNNENAIFVYQDVSMDEDWPPVVQATLRAFGRIDILVNNAGIGGHKHIVDMTADEYLRVIMIDQVSVFLGMKYVSRIMKEQGGGSIVNISSVSGFNGSIGGAGYTSAKFAVRGLTQTAALEFARDGIRVNSIHPGVIKTPPILKLPNIEKFIDTVPMNRPGEVSEVSEAVIFLASDASSYCTASELVIDGGMMASSHVFSDWLFRQKGQYFSTEAR
jgi:3alpha(or 20beta)-hydroxysteroid dehydrogenase